MSVSNNNKSKDFDPWLEEVLGNKYIKNMSRDSLRTSNKGSNEDNKNNKRNIKNGDSKNMFVVHSKFLLVSTSFLFAVLAFLIFYVIYFGEKEQSKFKKVSAPYEFSENLKTSAKPSPSSKESSKTSPSPSPSKSPADKNIVYMNMDKVLGYSESNLNDIFDKPSRKDVNEYGDSQFIYRDNNYSKFVMIGVNSGKCTSLYTNSKSYALYNTLKIGESKATCEQKLFSIGYLKKSNDIWFNEGIEFKAFYDQFNNNELTAVLISKKTITTSSTWSKNYNNAASLCESMEIELFDLVNAIRVRNDLPALTWDSKAHTTARSHSIDMANNNFFSHTNKSDQDPFMRMRSAGITYSSASENIAFGQQNSVFAFESLMNSSEHRKNILDNYTRLGTGVAVGKGNYSIYYTQNFYSPM